MDIWADINNQSKIFEKSVDKLTRRKTGLYYTDMDLTDLIIKDLVSELEKRPKPLYLNTFLEPCAGTGNFVFSYIKALYSEITKEHAKDFLDNIYVCDINEDALAIYKQNLKLVSETLWGISLDERYFDKHIGSGLLVDDNLDTKYIPIQEVFPTIKSFDVVATNPPYKILKADKDLYEDEIEHIKDKERYKNIISTCRKQFKYNKGMLNLYKLFVEEILDRYLNQTGLASILIPVSFLSEISSYELRKHAVKDLNLLSVLQIPENNPYISAQQAMCNLLISKSGKTEMVHFRQDLNLDYKMNINSILSSPYMSLTAMTGEENVLWTKLNSFPKIKDFPSISVLRGELDLTLDKDYITCQKTEYPLLRGRNLGYYCCRETQEYVLKEFETKTKKSKYISQDRLACRQIANMNQKHRLVFSFVEHGRMLGNSCNFLFIDHVDHVHAHEPFTLYSVLGILNSKIINWYFNKNSHNNHISIYELNNLPLFLDACIHDRISGLVKDYLMCHDSKILSEIEEQACLGFGISDAEKLIYK